MFHSTAHARQSFNMAASDKQHIERPFVFRVYIHLNIDSEKVLFDGFLFWFFALCCDILYQL